MSSSRALDRLASRLVARLVAPVLLLAAFGALWGTGPGAGGPATAQTGPAAAQAPARVAGWEPLAVPGLGLPEGEGAATLAADGADLWLATETRVARFREGRWLAPESPEGVTRIFALAPTGGGGLWAFGFEGGAWRRDRQGRWRAQTAPTIADLYDAVAEDTATGEAERVWAVGYDYEDTVGVLLRWDGAAFQVEAPESLRYRRLESVARAPDGSLWAGGCDVGEPPQPPLLLRREPGAPDAGGWQEVALPLESGCVRDLSFADDGSGLAAAGTDLLAWDGAGWTALGLAPPTDAEGAALSWVRAATYTAGVGPDGPYRARWALAGLPTWRGYEDAAPPRVQEDGVWREVVPRDHGLSALLAAGGVAEPARPYLDLTTDGARAWTFTAEPRVIGDAEGFAALYSLEAGAGRLEHPLIAQASDVALRPEAPRAEVWAAPYLASHPLRRREEGRWEADASYTMVTDTARLAMDVAGEAAAWAHRAPRAGQEGTEAVRWDGQSWTRADAPGRVTQLRALPDGGAWARLGRSGRMLRWRAPEGWTAFPEAPAVVAPLPRCPPELGLDCEGLMAPFDLRRGPEGQEEGWLADDEGRLQRWDGSAFRPQGEARGRVLDLALTETGGWAIAWDVAAGRDEVEGALLRLREGRWREIPALPRIGNGDGRPIEDLRWNLMSPVSDDAVWLAGVLRQGREERGVLLSLAVADEGPRTRVEARELYMDCAPQAMAAAPLPEGGSELLLAGFPNLDRGACRHLRLEEGRAAWTALAPRPQPWLGTGPVSRIVERPARGRLALPWLGR